MAIATTIMQANGLNQIEYALTKYGIASGASALPIDSMSVFVSNREISFGRRIDRTIIFGSSSNSLKYLLSKPTAFTALCVLGSKSISCPSRKYQQRSTSS